MDETSVCFELTYRQTLELKGVNHVGVISDDKLQSGYLPAEDSQAFNDILSHISRAKKNR